MKNTLVVILILALMAVSAAAQAQSGSGDGYNYAINPDNTNTITITGYTGPGGAVSIPTNINGLVVTGIGNGNDPVFSSSLTSVTIPASVTNIGAEAFAECGGLSNVFFKGNAPAVGSDVFDSVNPTAYYLAGTTGWAEFSTNAGIQAVLWDPLIQTDDGSFGVKNNQFGFNITGTTNIPIVVEACTNLANPVWTPLQTLNLTNGLEKTKGSVL